MPRPNLPVYGIGELHLFPVYMSREEFKRATGQEPPPFDPKRPPKYWADPSALTSVRPTVVYQQALVVKDDGQPLFIDGKPVLDILALPRMVAASVNIQPAGSSPDPMAGPPVQVPLRDLFDDEVLEGGIIPGTVQVRNMSHPDSQPQGFTAADRAMLKAIAAKLGV